MWIAVVAGFLGGSFLVLALFVEDQGDVGGVGVVDDGEMAPALDGVSCAVYDTFLMGVVDDGDGLCGERGLGEGFDGGLGGEGDGGGQEEGGEEWSHLGIRPEE